MTFHYTLRLACLLLYATKTVPYMICGKHGIVFVFVTPASYFKYQYRK